MEQLIASIVAKVGIDDQTARSAVGTILKMFTNEGPADKVSALMSALPGAQNLIDNAPSPDTPEADDDDDNISLGIEDMLSGGLGGESNPIMDTLAQLQDQGLSVDQAMQVGKEVAGFAREQAGDEVVSEIASSIPGLSAVL